MTPTDKEIYALATSVYNATKYQKWKMGVASDLQEWRATGLQRPESWPKVAPWTLDRDVGYVLSPSVPLKLGSVRVSVSNGLYSHSSTPTKDTMAICVWVDSQLAYPGGELYRPTKRTWTRPWEVEVHELLQRTRSKTTYVVSYKELEAALKAHKAQGPLCSLCRASLEEVESAVPNPSSL